MKDIFTILLRGRKVLLGRDFYQFRQVRKNRITLGNRFAAWTFCPDSIDSDSVVYSFGTGTDISFDLLLMERFNLQIHAFDPSPRSVDWIKNQNLPEGFRFFPYGLAAKDGNISFAEPAEPGIHSLFATNAEDNGSKGLKQHQLPVHRLDTIMDLLGHQKIDILKMDIEGAEYEVIDTLIKLPFRISQLLVEFHHRFSHIGLEQTRKAISALNQAGYKIFHVSANGEEFSFINTGN